MKSMQRLLLDHGSRQQCRLLPNASEPSLPLSSPPPNEEDVEEINRSHPPEIRRDRSKHISRARQARYRLSGRFFNKIFTLALSKSYGEWKAQIQTNNVRPRTAEIFQCCRLLDVDGVRRLIEEGSASPLDVYVDNDGGLCSTVEVRRAIQIINLH